MSQKGRKKELKPYEILNLRQTVTLEVALLDPMTLLAVHWYKPASFLVMLLNVRVDVTIVSNVVSIATSSTIE